MTRQDLSRPRCRIRFTFFAKAIFLFNSIFICNALLLFLVSVSPFENRAFAQSKMPDKPSQAQAAKAGLNEDASVESGLDELADEEIEDEEEVASDAESDSITAAPDDMPRLQRKKAPAPIVSEDPLEIDQTPVPQIKKKKGLADPQFRQGSRFIEHPNASKGLIKIEKDRAYIYKVKSSEQTKAVSVRLGSYEPVELASPENTALSYETLYGDESIPILLYDQEKQFAKKFGKLAWKWGTGFKMATGHGAFEVDNPARGEPPEKFTLFIFPFNVGMIYRFQYWDKQPIVPYVEGGVDGIVFAEYRDDDQNPPLGAAFGLAPATHFSLGGSLQLGQGARSFLDLDREYGINSMWLSAEYRYYVALSDKYDFTGDAITAGITAEY